MEVRRAERASQIKAPVQFGGPTLRVRAPWKPSAEASRRPLSERRLTPLVPSWAANSLIDGSST